MFQFIFLFIYFFFIFFFLSLVPALVRILFIHFECPGPGFIHAVRVRILLVASSGLSPDINLVRFRILSDFHCKDWKNCEK